MPYVSNDLLLQAMQHKRRRDGESLLDYADRIERYIQRLQRRDERRENRKNFWNEILFNKKKGAKVDRN